MLSIRVALVLLILVGLVIVDSRLWSKMHSRNSWVFGWTDCLRRSKLWLSPIIHSYPLVFIFPIWVLIMVEPYNTFISFGIYFSYLGIKCLDKFTNVSARGPIHCSDYHFFSIIFNLYITLFTCRCLDIR